MSYHPSDIGVPVPHGTHVAGIGAGGERSGGPMGMAPRCQIAFVDLAGAKGQIGNSLCNSCALHEAIDCIRRIAGSKPVVLNLSMGLLAGPHDGSTLMEQVIDAFLLEAPGRACIQSCGNYYSKPIHARGIIHPGQKFKLKFRTGTENGISDKLDIWYPRRDKIMVELVNPAGNVACHVVRGTFGDILEDGTPVGRAYNREYDPNNGDNEVLIVLSTAASKGDWEVNLVGIDVVDGRFNCWVERESSCPTCQPELLPPATTGESTTNTICNGFESIAVGAYDPHQPDWPLAAFSSSGPTRDGRIKPNVLAPGVRIVSSRASSREPTAKDPLLAVMSGTSMASPYCAGVVALMFEAVLPRYLPASVTREILLSTSTPLDASVPPNRWGSGYLNVRAAVNAAKNWARRLDMEETIRVPPTPEAAAWPHRTPFIGGIMNTAPGSLEGNFEIARLAEALMAIEPMDSKDNDVRDISSLSTLLHYPAHFLRGHLHQDSRLRQATVMARGGELLDTRPLPGDIVIQLLEGGRARTSVIATPGLLTLRDVQDNSMRGATRGEPAGMFVHVIERYPKVTTSTDRLARQVTDAAGRFLEDLTLIRLGARAKSLLPIQETVTPASFSLSPATICQLNLFARTTFEGAVETAQESEGGLDERWLQSTLNRALDAGLTVDGMRGPRTVLAIKQFQKNNGLKADGIVGPQTLAALRTVIDGPGPAVDGSCAGVPAKQVIDNFEFGKADVLPRHLAQIQNLAACILASQRTQAPIGNITIIGHTDPVGTDSDNLNLGRRRAEAVRDQMLTLIMRLSGDPARLAVTIQTRGRLEPVPGDPGLSRRVEVRLPFALPKDGPAPTPRLPTPAGLEAALRDLLTISMLLTSKPSASFTLGALPSARQSTSLWEFSLAFETDAMVANDLRCVVKHSGGQHHAMPVLEKATWEAAELELVSGQRSLLPISGRFLLGSFSAKSGHISARKHRIWRLESDIDIGTTAVFAYDITNPSSPVPLADLSVVSSSKPNQSPSRLWAIVCCEIVLCKPRNDFEPLGALEAARFYPLIEILTNAETRTIQGAVILRRPLVSAMDHGWANGGRHLVSLYSDRNEVEKLALDFPSPVWDNLFAYFQKDGAARAQNLKIVDASKTTTRSDGTHRRVLARLKEELTPSTIVKVPRQGAFDNVHISPPMNVGLAVPLLGAIPATAVSMAPVCAHDCFHMHWRWSQDFTNESSLGWGPSGPYSLAGAPLVHPNQTVTFFTMQGVPGFRYCAVASSQPPNEWMVVMPHGGAYGVGVTIPPSKLLDQVLEATKVPRLLREAVAHVVANESADTVFAWFYFFIQFWPSFKSRPDLRPLNVVDADVPFLASL